MQFLLKITLGNDAMLSGKDISEALDDVSSHIRTLPDVLDANGIVLDYNGNTVGEYSVDDDKDGLKVGATVYTLQTVKEAAEEIAGNAYNQGAKDGIEAAAAGFRGNLDVEFTGADVTEILETAKSVIK